jgi:hypothetical protein
MYHYYQPALFGLGVEERTNPLPVGRYWIDVFGDNRAKMSTWLSANRLTVQAVDTESFAENPGGPARDFYIFKVTAPTAFDMKTFGFPDIAGATVNSSADTVQEPPPEPSGTDQLQSVADTVSKVAFWGVIIVGGVLVLRTMDALSFLTGTPRR